VTRLDDEYNPAEHHDLDRTDRSLPDPITGEITFTPVCACGWKGTSSVDRGSHKTRGEAFIAWDQHRHREIFG
jgi:hypothetical protein